ncbi:hypothetical protein AQUCO_01300263v1 [Aquilegia coerulea]|uniref:TF-B3 domain-containing protein n=1 Tax=Aquilegia coerulea TaxID=218851 RepID=A0A2G5E0M9_AQUCA|nr:hypothetical protein AQUCO_01300263v1 [Aquilegia coerulea]
MEFSARRDGPSEGEKSRGKAKQKIKAKTNKSCINNSQQQLDEHWPLSDKPYFHYILADYQVQNQFLLVLPAKIHKVLPKAIVPVILTCRNKNWKMQYYGVGYAHQKFDSGWKNFSIDNKLNVGDGCVFELTECSTECIKFRVQILSGELPAELLNRGDGSNSTPDGATPDTPIIIF